MTVKGFNDKLKRLDILRESQRSISETLPELLDLNVEQMNEGKRSDGSDILPSYTDFTIQMKKEKGQPYDRVTLRDTGKFQSAINGNVTGGKVIVSSSDSKVDALEKKYSTQKGKLFGLAKEKKKVYIKDLRPALAKNIKKQLGIK